MFRPGAALRTGRAVGLGGRERRSDRRGSAFARAPEPATHAHCSFKTIASITAPEGAPPKDSTPPVLGGTSPGDPAGGPSCPKAHPLPLRGTHGTPARRLYSR